MSKPEMKPTYGDAKLPAQVIMLVKLFENTVKVTDAGGEDVFNALMFVLAGHIAKTPESFRNQLLDDVGGILRANVEVIVKDAKEALGEALSALFGGLGKEGAPEKKDPVQ